VGEGLTARTAAGGAAPADLEEAVRVEAEASQEEKMAATALLAAQDALRETQRLLTRDVRKRSRA
jgi:hypothetical protein